MFGEWQKRRSWFEAQVSTPVEELEYACCASRIPCWALPTSEEEYLSVCTSRLHLLLHKGIAHKASMAGCRPFHLHLEKTTLRRSGKSSSQFLEQLLSGSKADNVPQALDRLTCLECSHSSEGSQEIPSAYLPQHRKSHNSQACTAVELSVCTAAI